MPRILCSHTYTYFIKLKISVHFNYPFATIFWDRILEIYIEFKNFVIFCYLFNFNDSIIKLKGFSLIRSSCQLKKNCNMVDNTFLIWESCYQNFYHIFFFTIILWMISSLHFWYSSLSSWGLITFQITIFKYLKGCENKSW